jgi:hypothetical protein
MKSHQRHLVLDATFNLVSNLIVLRPFAPASHRLPARETLYG